MTNRQVYECGIREQDSQVAVLVCDPSLQRNRRVLHIINCVSPAGSAGSKLMIVSAMQLAMNRNLRQSRGEGKEFHDQTS
jgi:hypothetical protein